jgi:hypothetical protein
MQTGAALSKPSSFHHLGTLNDCIDCLTYSGPIRSPLSLTCLVDDFRWLKDSNKYSRFFCGELPFRSDVWDLHGIQEHPTLTILITNGDLRLHELIVVIGI